MTDVWKSNARKFCEICKVWFADNRVSIEHHEAGQKHKAAIQAKLRELARQNKEKEKANASLEATLAMMESAAMSSMKIDKTLSTVASSNACRSKSKTYFDPKAHKDSLSELAQEIARRKKELKKSQEDADKAVATGKAQNEAVKEPVWVQALSNEGVPYYFHMYSGETTWETPIHFLTAEQYSSKYAEIKQQLSDVLPSTSSIGEIKNSGETPAEEDITKKTEIKPEISEETRIAMAANFRLGDAEIPLPPNKDQPSSAPVLSASLLKPEIKTEIEENDDNLQTNPETDFGGVKFPAESVDDSTLECNTLQDTERSSLTSETEQTSHPYGAWKRVEKSPEPQKINYGLPIEAKAIKKKHEVEIKPEDIVVFSEKTAIISRKKKNLNAPVQFKKRKTNLSIRKQGNIS